MSTPWALVISAVLLIANGFFVAAEFALVASKRFRLEQAAATGSRAARAALAGSRELSLMLAGAQLGITLCSLGLGALAEPAIAHVLHPWLAATGMPDQASYMVAFLIALAVVVFLHMLIGEMAPKSWAITHPERSALLLALPFRGFARLVRPVLAVLNWMANTVLRLIKVQPQAELAQAHGPQELRMLLEQSHEHGLLDTGPHRLLTRMLQLQNTTVMQVAEPAERLVTVALDDPAEKVEAAGLASGRSRLGVVDAGGRIVGLVHVRDAVRATTAGRPACARELMTDPVTVASTSKLTAAITLMRDARVQLALVVDDGGEVVGFVALEDLLEEVIGEFYDETDASLLAAVSAVRGGGQHRPPPVDAGPSAR